jgi:hypothetical protein
MPLLTWRFFDKPAGGAYQQDRLERVEELAEKKVLENLKF